MDVPESKSTTLDDENLRTKDAAPLWDPTTGEVCSDALLDLARGIEVSDKLQPNPATLERNQSPDDRASFTEETEKKNDNNDEWLRFQHVDDCAKRDVSESAKDMEQAKRHLRYLSTVIESEREAYCAEAASCKALRHEILEKETQIGLSIDSLKLALIRQSRMIRCLQDHNVHPMLFREFEHEIQPLHRNIRHAWNDQAKAVQMRFSKLIEEASANKGCSVGVGTLQLMKREVNTLENERRQLSKLAYEMSKRSREDTKLRFQITEVEERIKEHCCGDIKIQKELETKSLACAALEAELLRARELIEDALETNKMLQQRVVSAEKEASELELYAAQIHREQERNRVLDRFVTKHSKPDTRKSEIMEAKDRIQRAAHDIRRSLYVIDTARNNEHMQPLIARFQDALDELVLRSFKALSREQETSAALFQHVAKS